MKFAAHMHGLRKWATKFYTLPILWAKKRSNET